MTAPIMDAISKRAQQLANIEPTRHLEPDVIDLSGDEFGRATTNDVRAAAIAALDKHLGDHYTRRPGLLSLCQTVADALAADDIAVDVENGIVISSSIQEARYIALSSVAADKIVYLPAPSCASDYAVAALSAGARVELFDLNDLPQISGGVLLLPNPNPATGQLYDFETVQRLARWATESNLFVISDETLAPLLRPGFALTRIAALPGMSERTMTLSSFRGIAGSDAWLVSWIAGPKSLVAPARGLKLAVSLVSPAVTQQAALAVSSNKERGVEPDATRIQAIETLLKRHGVPYLAPHTAAFIVADVSKFGGGDAVATACARAGIRVKSGSSFGSPRYIRITAAASDFERGLKRLDAVLSTNRNEHPALAAVPG